MATKLGCVLTGPASGSAQPGAPVPNSPDSAESPARPGPSPATGGLPQPVRWLVQAAVRLARLLLAPSPVTMRRLALAGLLASAGIILTGAAVRLSQSGLGCPDWPACTAHSLAAAGTTGSSLLHRWIEFGNRMLTGVILVVAAAVSIAAWRFRVPGPQGQPGRRRDLLLLALAQPAGIVAQAVLGGIVVLTKLDPVWVSVHFMLSIGLVALAVALHTRTAAIAAATATPATAATPAQSTDPGQPTRVRRDLRFLSMALVAAVTVMLAAGTVVTGTGPLAGARGVARYHLPQGGVTQLHADIGWLLTGITLALVAGLHFTGAPRRPRRLGWAMIGLILAQGAIGYTQYFTGLPAGLVWVHVTGAILIWITALRLMFALTGKGPLTTPSKAIKAAVAG
ncbi:MAG: COX15/CtaA family protein [Actinomycetota bacterium]